MSALSILFVGKSVADFPWRCEVVTWYAPLLPLPSPDGGGGANCGTFSWSWLWMLTPYWPLRLCFCWGARLFWMYANATATAEHTGSQLGSAYGHRQDDPDAPAPGGSDVREERPGVAAFIAPGRPPLRRLGDPICSFFIVSSDLPLQLYQYLQYVWRQWLFYNEKFFLNY